MMWHIYHLPLLSKMFTLRKERCVHWNIARISLVTARVTTETSDYRRSQVCNDTPGVDLWLPEGPLRWVQSHLPSGSCCGLHVG